MVLVGLGGVLLNVALSIILGTLVGLPCLHLTDDVYFDPALVHGKHVLITGASSGIGEQLAYQYARHGASVFLTARRGALLQKVSAKCRELGAPSAEYQAADMTRMLDAARVVHLAHKAFGRLDHVVICHAHFPNIRRWQGTNEDFADIQVVFDVNVKSYIHIATNTLRYLQASNGSLGILGSIAGKLYAPNASLYTMSKHALDGFFSTLRLELGRAGINVSVTNVVLGGIATDRKRQQMETMEVPHGGPLGGGVARMADAADAAWRIMGAVTMRRPELYFPASQYVKHIVLLRDWIPSLAEVSNSFPNR